MQSLRTIYAARLLALASAMGLVLASFAQRPPCACAARAEADAAATPACPHCAAAADAQAACCQRDGCGRTSDCDCPCCHGTPADQPLIAAEAASPAPVEKWAPLIHCPPAGAIDLPIANVATGGWRSSQLAHTMAPRLDRLCRWII